MKYLQLQKDFLTLIDNANIKNKGHKVMHDFDEETGIYGISDGYRIYFIQKERMFIDTSKTKHLDLTKLYTEKGQERLEFTNTIKESDKNKYRLLKTDKFKVWVNDKFFKYFDKNLTTYKGSGSLSPVLCYERTVDDRDKLVGILLPIRSMDDE